jgi:hypothetical protein
MVNRSEIMSFINVPKRFAVCGIASFICGALFNYMLTLGGITGALNICTSIIIYAVAMGACLAVSWVDITLEARSVNVA